MYKLLKIHEFDKVLIILRKRLHKKFTLIVLQNKTGFRLGIMKFKLQSFENKFYKLTTNKSVLVFATKFF